MRPPRRMSSVEAIAAHHGLPAGSCWRCGRPDDVERAHLIDRSRDGLDGLQNLVLLCHRCHAAMPSYGPGDEPFAFAWALLDRGASAGTMACAVVALVHAWHLGTPGEWINARRVARGEAALTCLAA